VGLQLLLVLLLIFFPEMVTGLLDKPVTSDLQNIEILLDPSLNESDASLQRSVDDPADYFKKK
jgi:hypothetical protein